MELLSYIIFLIIIEVSEVYGLNVECDGSAKNCSECMSSSPLCFWCSDHDFNDATFQRCASKQRLKDWKCNENHIISIENSKTVVKNDPFNQKVDSTVQLKPQRVVVRLRPNIPIQIPIEFQEAEDYPMDLYYLMDLSCTMKPHQKILAKVGKQIADKISSTTKNFRMGFGSFVDKTVIPFTDYDNSKPRCDDSGGEVEPPYSYKNRMSLNVNTTAFVESVRSSKISTNKDAPEGTLDALMQTMVCKDQIKWRDQSRKIIVVATDNQFHYANDGKLGGILYPNDGECHTTNDTKGIGIYNDWDVYDYPTMHQIAEKVREKKFFIVFSVDEKVSDVYQTLAQIIGTNNAAVAPLKDNDNVVTAVIENVYKSIRSSVALRILNKSDDIKVELYSNCSNSVSYRNRSQCANNFRRNQVISFDANITLLQCPKHKSQTKQSFQIGLTNVNENVTIEVEMVCECDCEKAENAQSNSPKCSNSGSFGCGICFSCNTGKTGRKCECDNRIATTSDLKSLCRKEGDINFCSEHGKCDNCGNCECDAQRSGRHCEFDDSTCFTDNIACTHNGKCVNGNCQCYPQFEGKFCDCLISNATCINSASNVSQICSGNGDCKCGSCQCKINWFGQYCEVCPKCESKQFCDHIIDCVPQICSQLSKAKTCRNSCYLFSNYSLINEIDNITNNYFSHNFSCLVTVNDCDNSFSYLRIDSDSNNLLPNIYITPIKTVCPIKADPITISLGVIGGTILIGLALILLWKLCTEIIDRKEFAKFQRELDKSKWSENTNPLFKDVSTTFQNPTFQKDK